MIGTRGEMNGLSALGRSDILDATVITETRLNVHNKDLLADYRLNSPTTLNWSVECRSCLIQVGVRPDRPRGWAPYLPSILSHLIVLISIPSPTWSNWLNAFS